MMYSFLFDIYIYIYIYILSLNLIVLLPSFIIILFFFYLFLFLFAFSSLSYSSLLSTYLLILVFLSNSIFLSAPSLSILWVFSPPFFLFFPPPPLLSSHLFGIFSSLHPSTFPLPVHLFIVSICAIIMHFCGCS